LVDLVAIKGYCDRAEVKPEEGKIKGDVKTNVPRERPRRSIQGLILRKWAFLLRPNSPLGRTDK